MSQDGTFLSALSEGFGRYGAHFGGSRLSNLRFAVFEEAEAALAEWTGAEATLSLSSGSLAGQLLVKFLSLSGYALHPAPGLHPALCADVAPYSRNMAAWIDEAIALTAQRSAGKPAALMVNAIDPLRVRATDFSWVDQLAGPNPVILAVDDSHGFGVTGHNGGGIHTILKVPDNVTLLVVSSLGKALGLPGGFIAGPRHWISHCWQSPFFGGASPMSPAFLHAFLQCRALYAQKRQVLLERILQFSDGIQHLNLFRFLPEYPVFYTQENRLEAFLAARRVLISSFAYPTPADPLITRLVINSEHTSQDIQTLINLVVEFAHQNRII